MHCTVLHKNQLRDELSFERLNAESFEQFFGAYRMTPCALFKSVSVIVSSARKNRLSSIFILIPLHSLDPLINFTWRYADLLSWDIRRLTFFVIAPKLKELQSCAMTQIEDKNVLFPNLKLKAKCERLEWPWPWVFIRKCLLGKCLVHSELP